MTIDNRGRTSHDNSLLRPRDRRRIFHGTNYWRLSAGAPPSAGTGTRSLGRASNRVVHHKHHNGAHDGHQQAVEIQTGDSAGAERVEQPPSSDSSYDSEYEVQNQAFTSLVGQ
jgi:hypothetical protein